METQKKGKTGVVAILIVVLLAGGFYVFTRNSESANPISTTTQLETEEAAIGKKLLASLLELNRLKLDEKFFDNGLFNSLQDFSVTLVPVPVGRPNPFLPTGATSGASGAAAAAGASLAQ